MARALRVVHHQSPLVHHQPLDVQMVLVKLLVLFQPPRQVVEHQFDVGMDPVLKEVTLA